MRAMAVCAVSLIASEVSADVAFSSRDPAELYKAEGQFALAEDFGSVPLMAMSWQPARWLSLDGNVVVERHRMMGGGGVTVRRGAGLAALRVRDALVELVVEHEVGDLTVGVTIEDAQVLRGGPRTALLSLSRAL